MNFSFQALQLVSIFNHKPEPSGRHLAYKNIPNQLDLRETGFVGAVHDQGRCNSCWAFSAAGSIEFHVGKEVSVQNILDCSPDTYGCGGGLMAHVFEYYDAFPLKYEYGGAKHKCMPHHTGVHVKNYIALEEDIENNLPFLLAQFGPVAVGVDFHRLRKYRGLVVEPSDCDKNAHHAALVVGYTPNYWIIKNSMGVNWGDGGYAYLSRGKNTCGIDNSYATVATEVEVT